MACCRAGLVPAVVAAGGRGGWAIEEEGRPDAKLSRERGGCTRWAGVTGDLRSKLLV
jgi:hypothetical protein